VFNRTISYPRLRGKVALALLFAVLAAATVALSQRSSVQAGPVPPRPEWIDSSGRVVLPRVPVEIPVFDSDGKVAGHKKLVQPPAPSSSDVSSAGVGKNRKVETVDGAKVESVETLDSQGRE
jgi:hypothetical protein